MVQIRGDPVSSGRQLHPMTGGPRVFWASAPSYDGGAPVSPGRQLHPMTAGPRVFWASAPSYDGGTLCLLGVSCVPWDAAEQGVSVWRATVSGPREPGCREDSCPPQR